MQFYNIGTTFLICFDNWSIICQFSIFCTSFFVLWSLILPSSCSWSFPGPHMRHLSSSSVPFDLAFLIPLRWPLPFQCTCFVFCSCQVKLGRIRVLCSWFIWRSCLVSFILILIFFSWLNLDLFFFFRKNTSSGFHLTRLLPSLVWH